MQRGMPSDRVWVKVHHSKTGETVVAVCDEELLGKKIEVSEGFTVEVSEAFYGGALIARDDLDKYIIQAKILNLLGETAVSYMVEKGVVPEGAVIRVGNIPHVQIYF
ncbi:MAG: DUF424 family protein, partial [Thaumarchaeota archaeon]|jgi:hypothetical protein|nr:DUF424 family protein [Candidatus Wolframiiraptor allenii]